MGRDFQIPTPKKVAIPEILRDRSEIATYHTPDGKAYARLSPAVSGEPHRWTVGRGLSDGHGVE